MRNLGRFFLYPTATTALTSTLLVALLGSDLDSISQLLIVILDSPVLGILEAPGPPPRPPLGPAQAGPDPKRDRGDWACIGPQVSTRNRYDMDITVIAVIEPVRYCQRDQHHIPNRQQGR